MLEIPKQNFFKRTLASLITSFSIIFSKPAIEEKKVARYYLEPERKPKLIDSTTPDQSKSDAQTQNILRESEQGSQTTQDIDINQFEKIFEKNKNKFVFLFSELVESTELFNTEKTSQGTVDEMEKSGKHFAQSLSEISDIPESQRLITTLEILRQAVIFHKENLSQLDVYYDEKRAEFFQSKGFLLKPEFCKVCITKALEQSFKICKAEIMYQSRNEIPTVGSELEIPKYFFYNAVGITDEQKKRYAFLNEDYNYISVFQGFLNGMGIFTYGDDGAHEIVSPPFYSAVGLSSFQSTIRELTEHIIHRRLGEPKALTSTDAPELPLHLNYAIKLDGIDIEGLDEGDTNLLGILSSAFSSVERIEKQEYKINSKGMIRIVNFDKKLKTTTKPASTRLEIRVHEYNGNNLAMITRAGQNMVAAFECVNRLEAGQQLTETERTLAFSWIYLKKFITEVVFNDFFPALQGYNEFQKLGHIASFMAKPFDNDKSKKELKASLFKKLRQVALDYTNRVERNILFKK